MSYESFFLMEELKKEGEIIPKKPQTPVFKVIQTTESKSLGNLLLSR